MHPAMYGYVRLTSDDAAVRVAGRITSELVTYAQREGFALERVFIDCATRSESAFSTMLDAIKCSEVTNILVPSLWHFARLPGLQDAMQRHIELETGARIWVVQGQDR